MILVTGATGSYGAAAIDHLLAKGTDASDIAALVRNPEKATDLKAKGVEIRQGDYLDKDSLVKAFTGVDKLLFVSGSEIETREAQHENVVKAAKEAKVGHILYTSFVRKEEITDSAISFLQDTHIKTENWIKDSGLPYTILQNALYMDMIPMFVGEAVVEHGAIVLPAENGKSTAVLRNELAEAAAEVILGEGHENKVYPLSNNDAYTYADVAEAISKATGKEVVYNSPSVDEFQKMMEENKVPAEYIGLFTAFSVAQAKGELELNDNTLEKLLGRKPTTMADFVKTVYA